MDAIYQVVDTSPGSILVWHVAHRARGKSANGEDVLKVVLTASSWTKASTTLLTATDDRWRVTTGWYHVPPGQSRTTFALASVSSALGPSYGNLVDDVAVTQIC